MQEKLNELIAKISSLNNKEFYEQFVLETFRQDQFRNNLSLLAVGDYCEDIIKDFQCFNAEENAGDYLGDIYGHPVVRLHSYPKNCFMFVAYNINMRIISSLTYYDTTKV